MMLQSFLLYSATAGHERRRSDMRLVPIAVLVLLVSFATPVFADTLTFPNNICTADSPGLGPQLTCTNGAFISQSYGDTASVNVTYRDIVITGQTLRWWDTG